MLQQASDGGAATVCECTPDEAGKKQTQDGLPETAWIQDQGILTLTYSVNHVLTLPHTLTY